MGEVILRAFKSGDADWLVAQHGRLYAREAGFDASFKATVAGIVADFIRDHDPECERGWIAEADGQRLGSIFCVRLDAETARLRLFLLVPGARGRGLGRRMLETCMGHAREKGFLRMRLWTHESHRAACALYARNGWSCIASKPLRNYGVDLVEQIWETQL